jgi:hypothetical protein
LLIFSFSKIEEAWFSSISAPLSHTAWNIIKWDI